MIKLLTAATVLAFASGAALAHGCPGEMRAIDAKLATNPKLAAADMEKVKKLRADGEASHKSGQHDQSMKQVAEAKKLLGL